MKNLKDDLDQFLATAAAMLQADGMNEAVELLRVSTPELQETGYDNWNNGTTYWTVYLLIDPVQYARLAAKREAVEGQIAQRLENILARFTNDRYSVSIAPKVQPQPEWRHHNGDLSRAARQNIVDGLKLDQVVWSGRLEEVEFLERLYDLKSLPSHDSRFPNAAGDIWQHRVNNPTDWDDDWIYSDARFNLLQGPTDVFLQFLCAMVHPVVRPDRNEALKLVQQFNDQLRLEGWELVEVEKIAGRPRFTHRRVRVAGGRSVSRARTVADALDAGWMQKEIERVEDAVERDPALAIGTAKELVESCCKSILTKRNIEFSPKADLPELTKLLAKELKLVSEGISEEAKGADTIRLILRNLSSLTQYLSRDSLVGQRIATSFQV